LSCIFDYTAIVQVSSVHPQMRYRSRDISSMTKLLITSVNCCWTQTCRNCSVWVSTATWLPVIQLQCFEGVLQLCFESAEISSRIQGQILQSIHHWRQSITRKHASFTWQIVEAVHWHAYVNQYPIDLGLSAVAHVTIQDLHVWIGFIFLSSRRVLKPLGCTQLGTNHSQAL
jgi:hypothetical protein